VTRRLSIGALGIFVVLSAILIIAEVGRLGPFAENPAPSDSGPVSNTARDAAFAVQMSLPRSVYHVGEAIEVATTATYVGSAPTVRAYSEWDSLVVFSLEQLDGPRDMLDVVSDLMCREVDLGRDQPIDVPFLKNGGYSATDPQAAFWKQYFADRELHLPAGQWRIVAMLDADLNPGCQHYASSLSTAVTFDVVP